MVKSPLIRPYFLGWGGIGGVPLGSHESTLHLPLEPPGPGGGTGSLSETSRDGTFRVALVDELVRVLVSLVFLGWWMYPPRTPKNPSKNEGFHVHPPEIWVKQHLKNDGNVGFYGVFFFGGGGERSHFTHVSHFGGEWNLMRKCCWYFWAISRK